MTGSYGVGVTPEELKDQMMRNRALVAYVNADSFRLLPVPEGEASSRGDEPGRASTGARETGPWCHICKKRNLVRARPRVYFCQRCKAGTLLVLHADGWRTYGVDLHQNELERLCRKGVRPDGTVIDLSTVREAAALRARRVEVSRRGQVTNQLEEEIIRETLPVHGGALDTRRGGNDLCRDGDPSGTAEAAEVRKAGVDGEV